MTSTANPLTAHILEQSQIQDLTISECRSRLKKLMAFKELDYPVVEHPELYEIADSVAETILNLEDRIEYLYRVEILANATAVRWNKDTESV